MKVETRKAIREASPINRIWTHDHDPECLGDCGIERVCGFVVWLPFGNHIKVVWNTW